jgi:hypothetical protein
MLQSQASGARVFQSCYYIIIGGVAPGCSCAGIPTPVEIYMSSSGAYTPFSFSSTRALLSTVQPDLAHEGVLELLKLSSNVNECKPLILLHRHRRITGS